MKISRRDLKELPECLEKLIYEFADYEQCSYCNKYIRTYKQLYFHILKYHVSENLL